MVKELGIRGQCGDKKGVCIRSVLVSTESITETLGDLIQDTSVFGVVNIRNKISIIDHVLERV